MASLSFTNRIRGLLVAFAFFVGTYFFHNEGQTLLNKMDSLFNVSIGHWGVFLKFICLVFGVIALVVSLK